MHLHFKVHENPAQFLKKCQKICFKSINLKLEKKTKASLEILLLYLLNMLNFKNLSLIATEI